MTPALPQFFGLGVYIIAIIAMTCVMVGGSYLLGPRRRGPADPNPFESGIMPIHDAKIRFPSQFYLVAMLFVVFDLETVFVFAWAIAARRAGWPAYGGIMSFLTLLLIALAYLWRSGALDWRPRARMPLPARNRAL
ncbi:NADH-quinone oxidoreductase subunit A [Acidiphilium sp. PA]|uniref:NADH-quinone oxidoreductase subunit A n=1 Tax=Acidiphilium sp. PA TaxID=2871705 RepID=UPI00224309DF|nr:NADH-quinone oxidoreductase subunit A [Acidiphilium sp. PA]MCW8306642.1 NADH-quinone oxidoreductase subunit A [Acidiphilium sp. PA]